MYADDDKGHVGVVYEEDIVATLDMFPPGSDDPNDGFQCGAAVGVTRHGVVLVGCIGYAQRGVLAAYKVHPDGRVLSLGKTTVDVDEASHFGWHIAVSDDDSLAAVSTAYHDIFLFNVTQSSVRLARRLPTASTDSLVLSLLFYRDLFVVGRVAWPDVVEIFSAADGYVQAVANFTAPAEFASNPPSGGRFGFDVAMRDDLLVISQPESGIGAQYAGAVHIYRRTSATTAPPSGGRQSPAPPTYVLEASLQEQLAPMVDEELGRSVAIAEGSVIAGRRSMAHVFSLDSEGRWRQRSVAAGRSMDFMHVAVTDEGRFVLADGYDLAYDWCGLQLDQLNTTVALPTTLATSTVTVTTPTPATTKTAPTPATTKTAPTTPTTAAAPTQGPSPAPPPSPGRASLGMSAKVGIGVAGVVLMAALAAGAAGLVIRRRRRKAEANLGLVDFDHATFDQDPEVNLFDA